MARYTQRGVHVAEKEGGDDAETPRGEELEEEVENSANRYQH